MATTYDEASLVLIPSGTKTSKIFSQKPVNGDGDFTFSRSTAATRVNADGNIEKETQNLLKYSNTFSDSDWTKTSGVSVTSGQTGYDGSSDAWLLTKSASEQYSRVQQTISSISGVYTYSVYAKEGTLSQVGLRNSGGADRVLFDLSDGSIGTQAGNIVDKKIEDIGNGWYRCSATFKDASSGFQVYVDWSESDAGYIYIQDAQAEYGLVARDYIETTTAAVEGGITDNVPRLDYTDSSCPALLLEPQRSNLVTYSEYIAGLSLSSSPTLSIESETNPEGYSFVYKVTATVTSSRVQKNIGTQGNNMVYSGFFKGTGTATRLRIRNNQGNGVQYNIDANGDFTLHSEDAANDNYGVEDYGNGWYRVYFETTTVDNADNFIQVYPDSQHGTGSVYIWGLQVEEGSYATSYIPTYGSAVTRNGESIANVDLTNIFTDSSQGTFVFEFDNIGVFDSGADARIRFGSATDTLQFGFYFNGSDSSVRFYDYESSGYLISDGPTNGESAKFAVKFQDNEAKGFVDGALSQTRTGSTYDITKITWFMATSSDKWALGFKKILFFPTALTDAECIDLTT